MKRFALVSLVTLFACVAYGQQGSIYAGGGVGFGNDSWRFAPEAGTWVADDLQLGLVLTIEGSDQASQPKNYFGPHLYFRKWWSVGDIFSLYLGVNGRYISSTNQSDVSNSQFDAFVDAGFALAVAQRWGMVGRVASVGYIDEDFLFEFNMSPQSMFNVGLYYTIKE